MGNGTLKIFTGRGQRGWAGASRARAWRWPCASRAARAGAGMGESARAVHEQARTGLLAPARAWESLREQALAGASRILREQENLREQARAGRAGREQGDFPQSFFWLLRESKGFWELGKDLRAGTDR
jgi:hypothetical protein